MPVLGRETYLKYEQEGLVPFVADSVYAMAHAIQNLLKDRCPRHGYIPSCIKQSIKGQELLSYIRNLSFTGKNKRRLKMNLRPLGLLFKRSLL